MITSRTTSNSSSKRSRFRRASQSGFTLVEVAMASFVMMFGISSAIIAMQSGLRHVDLARSTTMASQILESQLEDMRMKNWVAIYALPNSKTKYVDNKGAITDTTSANNRYTITITATNDSTRPTEVKNIKVSVTWTSFDGLSHTRSFSSLYAKNGLYDYYYTIAHP